MWTWRLTCEFKLSLTKSNILSCFILSWWNQSWDPAWSRSDLTRIFGCGSLLIMRTDPVPVLNYESISRAILERSKSLTSFQLLRLLPEYHGSESKWVSERGTACQLTVTTVCSQVNKHKKRCCSSVFNSVHAAVAWFKRTAEIWLLGSASDGHCFCFVLDLSLIFAFHLIPPKTVLFYWAKTTAV